MMKSLDELEREIDALCGDADNVMKFQDIQINLLTCIFNQEQMPQPVKSTPIKYKEEQQFLSSNVSTEASVKDYLQQQHAVTVGKFESTGHK